MRTMQPIASEEIPSGDQWVYEVKYDGFRATLEWSENTIKLISRNGNDLTTNFPEIIAYCHEKQNQLQNLLPIKLDGELVVLNTPYQANFSLLQQRGRLKTSDKIKQAANNRPAHFLTFDLLIFQGKKLTKTNWYERKQQLRNLYDSLNTKTLISWHDRIGYIEETTNPKLLWETLFEHHGEGIIAKRCDSSYIEGKSHRDWFKIKNWRTVSGILTSYNQDNGYFELAVYNQDNLQPIGKFKHGLDGEELNTLKTLVASKGTKHGDVYHLPPAICVDIHCLGVKEGELREPQFKQFRFDLDTGDCTRQKVRRDLAMFPHVIDLTKQEKIFWDKNGFTKGDLLLYLRNIAPFMLPFLKGKALTVIRCPDGVGGESFFQKHLPDYAPNYLAGNKSGEETLLHARSVEALVWLGNHGALEYHVPFQRMDMSTPNEIVFDLDPPSVEAFDVAIYAAQLLKQLLDEFHLHTFVKTSGNKGIQVYIPIPVGSLTYEQTATFTQGLAFLLEKNYPDLFTTERMKKNRNNRLYIDYVQHGKDKTLIAPYSPRKTEDATVSTPLFWEEVNNKLSPKTFTIANVVKRVKEKGCPFASYQQARDNQSLELVKQFIDMT
ncbi:DNA ligase D [Aquibacillus sediminis]|uniref:DNA ligase D n=1 Tax=Aquibacillus sediminis TaxID=2574734 RepID=UPI001107D0EB|nr:DNA ligase D [Aquibacillus sediminis]